MKKKSLKEKKKDFNLKKKKVLFTTEITVYDDNTTNVTGPIDNVLLMMQIFASAQNVVISHNMSLQKLRDDTLGKKGPKVVDHKPKIIL